QLPLSYVKGGTLSAGTTSASLPRQGVRRRCPQRAVLAGGHLASSLWGLRNVLFPRRTGRSSVERWSQDVTGFSRPGVDHLSLQTTRFTSCIKMFFTSDRCKGLLRIYDIYRLFTLHFKW